MMAEMYSFSTQMKTMPSFMTDFGMVSFVKSLIDKYSFYRYSSSLRAASSDESESSLR